MRTATQVTSMLGRAGRRMVRPWRAQPPAATPAALESLLKAAETRIGNNLKSALEGQERARRTDARNLYGQLEALLWLRDAIALTRPLPAARGWAASPDFLLEVVRWILRGTPDLIVELGSGVSTVVVASALRRQGRGHLVSLEHDATFAARTRDELAFHALTEWATVVDAPLVPTAIGEATWSWYDLSAAALSGRIDVLVVDGPPSPIGPLARYPALPLLHDRLSDDVVILLDDGDRPDERATIERWQAEFPAYAAVSLPLEKGAWVLRRTAVPR